MSGARQAILCLNAGSSSLKFTVWAVGLQGEDVRLISGAAEGIAQGEGVLLRKDGAGVKMSEQRDFDSHREALDAVQDLLAASDLPPLDGAGHRIVHGGDRFPHHTLLSEDVVAGLRELVPLAPLHLPPALAVIEATARRWPQLPQSACFDTVFHSALPETARRLPLPSRFHDRGVRRYGFHGLNYEWCVEALGRAIPDRTVIAHLGNGASLVALERGKPVDTTMGMTPSGGLMMGTRTGDLDPGVILYLMREEALSLPELAAVIDRESGLLGVSGLSADMKTLLENAVSHAGAALAIEMFCRTACKQIAAMAASLNGLDALVFTGGIGERAASIRKRICEGLSFLGLELQNEANRVHRSVIHAPSSRVVIRIVPAQEELILARRTRTLLAGRTADYTSRRT